MPVNKLLKSRTVGGIDSSLQSGCVEIVDDEQCSHSSVLEQSTCKELHEDDDSVTGRITPRSSNESSSERHDRRKKIEKYLKNQRHKKMSSQVSLQNQQLKICR